MVVTRGWGEGRMGTYCLTGRVSVWDDKKSSGNSDGVYTTL